MHKKIIILFLTIFPFMMDAQNLVQNGSFETNTGLPNSVAQWNLVTNWSNANSSSASPDYLHVNGSGLVQLPNSVFGTVNPYQGNAVMGFAMLYPNTPEFREYISQQLATPLAVGNTYTFSFYITNGIPVNYGGLGIQNVQVDFSVNPINQIGSAPLGYTPLLSSSTMIYSNTWIPVSFTFTATAPYAYFAIGNFMNDANTVSQSFDVTANPAAYYFVDEVSLFLDTTAIVNNNITITGDSAICLGDSATLTAHNGTNYSWADSSNPNVIISTNAVLTVSPLTTTTYFVYGNNDTSSFTVTVISPGSINLGNDITICQGQSFLLNATTPTASYLWQDNTTNPTYTVSQAGTYWVNVTVNNCTITDTVNVDTISCGVILVMPNVFTPNADGVNDYFHPKEMDGISQATLIVYDRWGQKIIETSDLSTGWNGKYNNKDCSDGTYFWIINYTTIANETKTQKGIVTLIK